MALVPRLSDTEKRLTQRDPIVPKLPVAEPEPVEPRPIFEGRPSRPSPLQTSLGASREGVADFLPGGLDALHPSTESTSDAEWTAEARRRQEREKAEFERRQEMGFWPRVAGAAGSLFMFEDAALEGAVDLIQGRGVNEPTAEGIKEAQREFSERPLAQQLGLGLASPSRAALGGEALQQAAKSAKVARNVVEEVAEELRQENSTVRKFVADQNGSVKWVDDEMRQTVDNPDTIGNKVVSMPRDLLDIKDDVVTTDNRILRKILSSTGINPSVAKNTEAGKLVTAYQRSLVAVDSMVDTALAIAHDSHRLPGLNTLSHVFPVGRDGIWKGTNKHWLDIMEKGGVKFTDAQTRFVNDMRRVVQETENLLDHYGLGRLPRNADGSLYFPRKVRGVRGIDFERPSNPKLQRIYEDAMDGVANGVDYINNPRAVLELHMRGAYRQILESQLSDAIKPMSLTPKELLSKMNPKVISAYNDAIDEAVAIANEVRRLQREIRTLKVTGPSVSAKRLRTARAKKMAALNATLRERKEALDIARAARDKARRRYSKALEQVQNTEVTRGKFFGKDTKEIPIAKWRNRFLPREDAKELTKGLETLYGRRDVNVVLKIMETVGNTVRAMSSTLDLALPLTHGLPVLARNPKAWGKGSAYHVFALFNPGIQAKFIAKKADIFREMAQNGIPVAKNEFFQVLEQGGSLSKHVRKVKAGDGIVDAFNVVKGQTAGRFQASYDTGLSVYRAMLWESLRKNWDGDLNSLAAYVRNLTGGLDTRALGVSPNRRAVESMWLAFSPRLLRSTVALTGDAVRAVFNAPRGKATAQQKQSFQAVATMVVGAMGVYTATGIALGKSQEEIINGMDPTAGKKFLSHEINGDWIGIGGQVRAIAQALAAISSSAAPGGRPIQDMTSTDLRDNPILNFYGSRGAPAFNIAGGAVEAATGGKADVLKYDDIENWPDYAKHLGTSAIPFTAQGRLEGEEPLTTAFALGGFRTSPETFGEARERHVSDIAKENGISDAAFDDLPPRLQDEANRRTDSERGFTERREQPLDQRVDFALEQSGRVKERVAERLERQLQSLPVGRPMREAIQDARKELFLNNRNLFDDEVSKALDQRSGERTALELLRIQYWTANPGTDPLEDAQWYRKRDEIRNEVIRQARQEGVNPEHVQQRAALSDDPVIQGMLDAYDKDQETLRQYWEGPNTLIMEALPKESKAIWQTYLDSPRHVQERMKQDSGIKQLIQAQRDIRQQIRTANPEVDVALLRWGYVSEPMTFEGADQVELMLAQ